MSNVSGIFRVTEAAVSISFSALKRYTFTSHSCQSLMWEFLVEQPSMWSLRDLGSGRGKSGPSGEVFTDFSWKWYASCLPAFHWPEFRHVPPNPNSNRNLIWS